MSVTESALQNPQHLHSLSEIILEDHPVCVVLSDPPHAREQISHMLNEATQGRVEVFCLLEQLRGFYQSLIKNLFAETEQITQELCEVFCALQDILQGIFHIKECSLRTTDYAHSLGKKLSCLMLTHCLETKGLQAQILDLSEYIVTEHSTPILTEDSIAGIAQAVQKNPAIAIVPGGIATTREQVIASLHPQGETYTAALVAVALNLSLLEIWGDKEGIFTADPRMVPDAFAVPRISIKEVMELSYFGSQILHPQTFTVLSTKKIPIVIKNILHPKGKGTQIEPFPPPSSGPVSGLSSISNVALINIEGNGMAGTVGIASRVFHALARSHTNIIMISQASSENSICLLCKEKDAAHAVKMLQGDLEEELHSRAIQNITVMSDLEIIAVVGANMKGCPGMASRIFNTLGQEHINIFAIAQGASEINISLVVARDQGAQALRLIHQTFFPKGSDS